MFNMNQALLTFLVFEMYYFCGSALAVSDSYREGARLIDNDDELKPATFNGNYLADTDETWLLEADEGVWGLVFITLDVEFSDQCRFDYLEIREPVNGTEIVHPSRYCGKRLPLPYMSKGSIVHIRFRSDAIWESSGFFIHAIHATDKDLLKAKLKHAASRTLPFAYPYRAREDNADNGTNRKGPLFFILIGAAASGLIIFTLLLLYVLIGLKRRAVKSLAKTPNVYYINQPNGTGNSMQQAPPTGQQGNSNQAASGGNVRVVMKSGRKYSRDKSAKSQGATGSCQEKTVPKTLMVKHSTHPANVYVTRGYSDPAQMEHYISPSNFGSNDMKQTMELTDEMTNNQTYITPMPEATML